MKLLRDLREATRLLILLELVNRRPRTLKPMAERLEMTIQGVSDYVKAMVGEGLIMKGSEGYRPTKKGVDFLHGHIRALREFVERSARDLRMVDVTAALAGEDVGKGQEVGLFMEGGHLIAYPGRASPSTGRALSSARRGQDLGVGDLEGITALTPGTVTVVVLPNIEDGGSAVARGRPPNPRGHVVVALDAVGVAYARQKGWRLESTFAPLQAALDASVRGQDVIMLCSADLLPEALGAIGALNAGLEDRVGYRTVNLAGLEGE